MARWLRIDAAAPSPDHIGEAASALLASRVVILPTDTVYGLHAMAMDLDAVRSLFRAKRRPEGQPLVVLCGSIEQLEALGVSAAPQIIDALTRIWPAPLTAILPLLSPIPASAGRNTVGVRIPELSWLRELVERTGPLASTSVNLSGESAVYSTDHIPKELLDFVDLVLDAGTIESESSTLVDFTSDEPHVVREGRFRFTQKLWKSLWKSL